MEPLISVIVPVWNTLEYLDGCLGSIVAQTHAALEIIVVDDASTDGSAEAIDAWAERDRRILPVHRAENGGLSMARNEGLLRATGDYIMFADSDDTLEKDMAERLLHALRSTGADIAKCGWTVIEGGKREEYLPDVPRNEKTPIREAYGYILGRPYDRLFQPYIWDLLVSRAALTGRDGKPILEDGEKRYCDDVLWQVKLFLNSGSIVFVDRPLYNYLQRRPGGLTDDMHRQRNIRYMKDAVASFTEIMGLLKENDIPAWKNAWFRLINYRLLLLEAARQTDRKSAGRCAEGIPGEILDYMAAAGDLQAFVWGVRHLVKYILIRLGYREK